MLNSNTLRHQSEDLKFFNIQFTKKMDEKDGRDTEALIESEQLRTKDEVAELEAEKPRLLPFSTFFKYISGTDYVLLILGILGTIVAGGILPSISLVMG